MPHSLICGMTTTGKSSVAKLLIPIWQQKSWNGKPYRIALFDPMCDPRWPLRDVDVRFTSIENFTLYCKSSIQNPLAIFIDEGASSLARQMEYNWFCTQARHWGHETHIISQFPTDLTPKIRGNCEWLYLFQCDCNAIDLLQREWNQPALKAALKNPKLHLHLARRLSETVHQYRVDWTQKRLVFLGDARCNTKDQASPAPPAAAGGAKRSALKSKRVKSV